MRFLFHLVFFRFYGFSFQGCNLGGYTMSWVPLISTIFTPNCGCFEVIPSRNPKQETPPRRSTRARADSVESDLGTPQNLNAASPFWRGIGHSITTGRGKSCLGLLGGWVWRKIAGWWAKNIFTPAPSSNLTTPPKINMEPGYDGFQ